MIERIPLVMEKGMMMMSTPTVSISLPGVEVEVVEKSQRGQVGHRSYEPDQQKILLVIAICFSAAIVYLFFCGSVRGLFRVCRCRHHRRCRPGQVQQGLGGRELIRGRRSRCGHHERVEGL